MLRLLATLSLVLGLASSPAPAQDTSEPPDPAMVMSMFGLTTPVTLTRLAGGGPAWAVHQGRTPVGYVGSTWEIANSAGYSGRPLDVLVALGQNAVIAGARLIRHNEPVLTLGISDADISAYVNGFAGHDLRHPDDPDGNGLPRIISRATVSTGVIRDGILRTARSLAVANGLIDAEGGIDRLSWQAANWQDLIDMGALAETRLSMTDAATALAGAKVPVPPGDGDFLHVWAGIAEPPTVGQNLLGQKAYAKALAGLTSGETLLAVMSSGLTSHRGLTWRRSGVFDRLSIQQGDTVLHPQADSYQMVKRLPIDGAPEIKEISLFRLPASIDPLAPLTIRVRASRPDQTGGEIALTLNTDYELPATLRTAPVAAPEPLWRLAWRTDVWRIGVVVTMLAALGLVFLGQEWLTKRPGVWRAWRLGFLTLSLVVLGWGLGGQLSIVQVIAFLHSLLNGFQWETFLIEPVIFLLWGFVALGLLFWGRGVYCGWLCPFGALQELTNALAVRLGVRQIEVPEVIHERLWILKYTAFVGIVALSFWSMHDALVLAEIEPFKTAISMRMMRAWPFVLFVVALLVAGLFIERFFCRYLCPLGAGLAIPAKLKIFDWLHRRPQCGRECRLCQTKCTVGAIDRLGRINPNECVLCLRCQVIMNEPTLCPVLKRRARSSQGGSR